MFTSNKFLIFMKKASNMPIYNTRVVGKETSITAKHTLLTAFVGLKSCGQRNFSDRIINLTVPNLKNLSILSDLYYNVDWVCKMNKSVMSTLLQESNGISITFPVPDMPQMLRFSRRIVLVVLWLTEKPIIFKIICYVAIKQKCNFCQLVWRYIAHIIFKVLYRI